MNNWFLPNDKWRRRRCQRVDFLRDYDLAGRWRCWRSQVADGKLLNVSERLIGSFGDYLRVRVLVDGIFVDGQHTTPINYLLFDTGIII